MKIIYLYVSNGSAGNEDSLKWDKTNRTRNYFANHVDREGPYCLLDRMVKLCYADELVTIIDSTRSPGVREISPTSKVYVVPHMQELINFVEPGDIIYARGGFKQWFSTLQAIANKKENWFLFYRANTNRGGWLFWDIILDDLRIEPILSRGRLIYPFVKPIDESLFYPDFDQKKIYDIMINASHIHSKKGQFLAVKAIERYQEIWETKLKCILPGRFIRDSNNKVIFDAINDPNFDIDTPGMVNQTTLCRLLNQTRLFMHIGVGGQNDRGTLEATRCGVPTLISNPPRFAPFISNNPHTGFVTPNNTDVDRIASDMKLCFTYFNNKETRKKTSDYYLKCNGMEEAAVPKMMKLFDFIKENPLPNREALAKEFIK